MAEIEDMRPAGKGPDDPLRLGGQPVAALDQQRGVQIALHAAILLDMGRRPACIEPLVERDRIGAGGPGKAGIALAGAARKGR
jgi:hypothetical protein